jgi:tetratricopeptide (TPR) repeat protein
VINNFKYVLLFFIALIIVSCSTKKNTGITRTYHNLTSHYNILFNGEESYKKGLKKLEDTYDDDFTELLPVFLYENKEALSGIAGEMDRSIKKMTKLISMHSLTVKPGIKPDKELSQKQKEFFSKKEFNKYIDDAYLLMGKSHFYKQEFSQAEETFDYIISNFPESVTVFETKIWLARLANMEEKYREAEDILKSLSVNMELPDRYKGELYATLADLHIKQKQYAEAIEPLTKAIESTSRKFIRTRYTYLLAQLYTLDRNYKMASENYDKVIQMNPPYKMTFSAKINRALSYQAGTGSKKDIEKQLQKMLKDDKNIDYQDQIYFAIGSIYQRDEILDKAIENYILSIQKSTDNKRQKAKSSLTLADIYYSKPDYINAQSYYDSAVAIIDKEYPDYQSIYAKSVSLNDLVENIKIVSFEDSVLRLAIMPEPELLAFIDKIIEKVTDEEEQKKLIDQQLTEDKLADMSGLANQVTDNAGNWYFYNPTTKTLGKKEFLRVWGNRKLEDNWRRKNKSVVSFGEPQSEQDGEETQGKITAPGEIVTNNKSRNFYLQYIPLTDSAKAQSQSRIMISLFKMGETYSDELKDFQKAIDAFEELLKRFPAPDNKLQVYYKLYTLSKTTEDIDRVSKYQQAIIREFPYSNFAKLMTNPDYIKEIAVQEMKVYDYYDETYRLFNAANYSQVIQRCSYAMKEYPDHVLYPKFDYMSTISAGVKKDTLGFVNDLQRLISLYPSTEIAQNAQIMISYLQSKAPAIIEQQNIQIAKELYSLSGNETHYFVYIVPAAINMNQLIFNIVNFNLDNFDTLRLEVKRQNLDGKKGLCLVQKFNNGGEAMAYLMKIAQSQEVFRDIDSSGITPAIISQSNLSKLIESGKVDQYLLFFKLNYR